MACARPTPGDGLEIVRENTVNSENASTWTNVAPPARFERATHGLGNRRSIL